LFLKWIVFALTPELISAANPGGLTDYLSSVEPSYRDFLLLKHLRKAKHPEDDLCLLTRTSGDILCEIILEAIFVQLIVLNSRLTL
jgi:hypothetical protein